MKQNIIHKATELFLTYGFKSVTMDDIASALGISKKTIYVHFKTKTALVNTTTLHLFDVISKAIDGICALKKHPVEELYDIKQVVMHHLNNEKVSPQYQLQKYYPKTFHTLKNKQFQMMQTCITQNLNRGISLGVYRKNINAEFMSKLYFTSLIEIRNNEIFQSENMPTAYVLEEFYEYHLRGICTPSGLETLQQFINKTAPKLNEYN